MKRVKFYLIILVLGLGMVPAFTLASQKNILISEVQTGSAESASDEFVELYNNTTQPLDISGWSLYYKSATGKTWSKKATVSENSVVASHDFWVFSSVIDGDTHINSGFSESGGNIQLKDKQGNVVEQFGWGSADSPLGQAASEAHGGQSMYRLYDDATQTMNDTDNNFADFDVAESPTPNAVPAIVSAEPDPSPASYLPLKLTELMPDPASPQSDSTDEFIEIYNPNSTTVNLDGWKLTDDSGKEFIIKGKTLAPNSYVALYIPETGITLNNTGDTISLTNPNGDVTDQSADYGNAKEGYSWSLIDGQWDWATSPTPGTTNATVYVEPDDFSPAASVAKVKKATTVKKTSAKAAAPKTSKATSAKSSSSNPVTKTSGQENSQSPMSNWWSWLLIALGVGTIGYGIYEYRSELQLFFKKLGGKLGFGRRAG